MSIYKKAVFCWFTDWSNYDTKTRKDYIEDMETEPWVPDQVDIQAVLESKLTRASKELKQVMEVMNSAPKELLAVLTTDLEPPLAFFYKLSQKLGISLVKTDEIACELRKLLKEG